MRLQILFVLYSADLYAQTSYPDAFYNSKIYCMPFFDFHCHPGLKPQFSNLDSAPSPWDKIKVTLQVPIIKSIGINVYYNEILNSQSCLSQLSKDVKLIGLVLHAPESNMARSLAERKIIQDGLVKPIDFERVQYIAEGTHYYA